MQSAKLIYAHERGENLSLGKSVHLLNRLLFVRSRGGLNKRGLLLQYIYFNNQNQQLFKILVPVKTTDIPRFGTKQDLLYFNLSLLKSNNILLLETCKFICGYLNKTLPKSFNDFYPNSVNTSISY